MKTIPIVMVFLITFSFMGNIGAYEGGTKIIAAMNQPERGVAPGALVEGSAIGYGTSGKLVTEFFRQMPEPTLSLEGIRKETPGPSLGTKLAVQFQKDRF